MEAWTQYGLLGLVIFLVLERGFQLINRLIDKGSNPKGVTVGQGGNEIEIKCSTEKCQLVKLLKELSERAREIQDKVKFLYDIHNKYDEDGSPKFYNKKTTLDQIAETAREVDALKTKSEAFYANQEKTLDKLNILLESLNSLLQKIAEG